MRAPPPVDWLVPCSLIVLSLVPVMAGVSRIAGLAAGGQGAPLDARFFVSPAPVVIHIVAASVFCLLGAFQFATGIRKRHPRWHRIAGRLLVPCGLVAAHGRATGNPNSGSRNWNVFGKIFPRSAALMSSKRDRGSGGQDFKHPPYDQAQTGSAHRSKSQLATARSLCVEC